MPETAPLAPEPPARGEWANPVERDPFEVPLEEKLAVLLAADAGLRTEPGVNLTLARFSAFRTEKIFASTEGALCEQRITGAAAASRAVAVEGADSQIRSYPASHGGHVAQAGYEHFSGWSSPGTRRACRRGVALLRRPPARPGGRR